MTSLGFKLPDVYAERKLETDKSCDIGGGAQVDLECARVLDFRLLLRRSAFSAHNRGTDNNSEQGAPAQDTVTQQRAALLRHKAMVSRLPVGCSQFYGI